MCEKCLHSFLPVSPARCWMFPREPAFHTYGTYERLPDARITLLDYSADMLGKAKRRMEHCEHIAFAQGDVGALPFDAGSSRYRMFL